MRSWLGLAALALACLGLWIDARAFWAAWLAAWCWSVGLVSGALTNAWMHRLTGGQWGEVLRPAGEALAHRMPRALALGLPLFAGLSFLYPWFDDAQVLRHGVAQPAFRQVWLSPEFFVLRLVAYAALWWLLARTPWPVRKGHAAAALMAQLVVGTLAAADLLMSLLPAWFSSVFGLLVLAVQALSGSALMVLLSIPALTHLGPAKTGRDLGNLLVVWMLLLGYLEVLQW